MKIWWTQYPLWDIGWTSLLVPLWLAACLIWHLDGIISFSGESLLTQAHCILATHNWRKMHRYESASFPTREKLLKSILMCRLCPEIFSLRINSWGTNDYFFVLALIPVLLCPSICFTCSLNLIAQNGTHNMTFPNQISCTVSNLYLASHFIEVCSQGLIHNQSASV